MPTQLWPLGLGAARGTSQMKGRELPRGHSGPSSHLTLRLFHPTAHRLPRCFPVLSRRNRRHHADDQPDPQGRPPVPQAPRPPRPWLGSFGPTLSVCSARWFSVTFEWKALRLAGSRCHSLSKQSCARSLVIRKRHPDLHLGCRGSWRLTALPVCPLWAALLSRSAC